MATNATTLTNAISKSDTTIVVGSATGITAPISTTGSGFTYLLVENEVMFVLTVSSLVIGVLRGQLGTAAVAHAASVPVLAGLPSDFQAFSPAVYSFETTPNTNVGFAAPIVGAATITAPGYMFHTTGSGAAMTTLKPPAYPPINALDGMQILIVFDGSGTALTWATGGTSPYAFSVGGTATTAGSSVTFTYDANVPGWIPSRLA